MGGETRIMTARIAENKPNAAKITAVNWLNRRKVYPYGETDTNAVMNEITANVTVSANPRPEISFFTNMK